MGTFASNFLLDEEKYKGIVSGWNEKLSSPSLKLSELTPFIELYAVFKSDDIIYKNPSIATEIDQRLVNVNVRENDDDKIHQIKVAPICSSNKTQLQNDSLNILGPSYRGQPGINDLTVARGAAASLNVKYDMQITIPNPEIFNELFEYSRLMAANSTFLLIYGWNTPASFSSASRPPNLSGGGDPSRIPEINLKTSGAGFYEAALVNIYKFDFSFDNVGHLTGKVSFLPEIGSFLVGTRTDTISKGILNRLISHDGVVIPDDQDVEFVVDGKTYTKKYGDAINPEVSVTTPNPGGDPLVKPMRLNNAPAGAERRIVGFITQPVEKEVEVVVRLRRRGTIVRDAEGNPITRKETRIVQERVVNELQTKIAQAAFEAASELQGRFDLPNDGAPYKGSIQNPQDFLGQNFDGDFNFNQPPPIPLAPTDNDELDILSTMPSYGANLMRLIYDDFENPSNPNYLLSDGLYLSGAPPRKKPPLAEPREGKADQQTYFIRRSTSIISVPLIEIIPDGDELTEEAEKTGTVLDKTVVTENVGQTETIRPKIFIQAQPVYFFLGAVLEAISKSISPAAATDSNDLDSPSVKFIYNDLPLDNNQKYSVPIPQPSKDQFESDKEALNEQIKDSQRQIKEINEKLADNSNFTTVDEEGNATQLEGNDLESAKGELRAERLVLGRASAIAEAQISNLEIITNGFIENFRSLEVANVFDLPVDISRVRSVMSNGNAPLHSLIKQIIDLANETNPTIKLATRPYSKNSRYIEVYAANIEVEGVSKDLFNSIQLDEYSGSTVEEKVADANRSLSKKTVVCEFGTERSLVENFSLNAKVDANAFASFRLPAVVGGQSVDISKLIANQLKINGPSLIADIEALILKGFISSKKELQDLQIVTIDPITNQVTSVSEANLERFLRLSESVDENDPKAAAVAAGRQVVVRLIDELRAADSNFNNSIIAKQNAALMMGADANSDPNKPSFFGGVLSNFLRRITLTIHGTVGLSTFNLIYVKGLMRGIEGIYQITSVTESLSPANFSTTLECALVNYKDNNKESNPFAANQSVSLTQLSETAEGQRADYKDLLDDTLRKIEDDRQTNTINWGGSP